MAITKEQLDQLINSLKVGTKNTLPTALLDSMDRETEKSIANRKTFPTRIRYSASHYYYKAHRIPGGQVSRAPSPRGPML
jgi:hypothetical protein